MLPAFKRFGNRDGLLFLLLLFLIILLRIFVLRDFAFKYTDSDQVMMWQGLKDYSAGEFHEPRFYGQAYNSMLESFLAVPFFKAGISSNRALPTLTSILALFPFALISFIVFLKKSPKLAMVILSIPLLLPVEYSLITSMPRGFVTGIFIVSFACIGTFYPKSNRAILLSFFFAVLGFSINANALLLAIPCVAYLFVENIRNKRFYLFSALGTIAGLAIHFFANHFYTTHPFYNIHSFELDFSFKDLFASFSHLDIYFNDVTPILWKVGMFSLIIFLITAILFYRKKEYKKAAITVLLPVIILLTLGINKVHDGYDSAYYSWSRMYLAIPVILALVLSWFSGIAASGYFYFYLIIPLSYFGLQMSALNTKIKAAVDPDVYKVVTVAEADTVQTKCNILSAVCENYGIDLILIVDHSDNDFYNYGCSSFDDNFPKTLRPSSDRRTWRYLEDENKIYHRVLLIDSQRNYEKEFEFVTRWVDSDFYLIENNTLPTMELINSLGIWCRPYKQP